MDSDSKSNLLTENPTRSRYKYILFNIIVCVCTIGVLAWIAFCLSMLVDRTKGVTAHNDMVEKFNKDIDKRYIETKTMNDRTDKNLSLSSIKNCMESTVTIPIPIPVACDSLEYEITDMCKLGNSICKVEWIRGIYSCLTHYYFVNSVKYFVNDGVVCEWCKVTDRRCLDEVDQKSKQFGAPIYYDVQNPVVHSYVRNDFMMQPMEYNSWEIIGWGVFIVVDSCIALCIFCSCVRKSRDDEI